MTSKEERRDKCKPRNVLNNSSFFFSFFPFFFFFVSLSPVPVSF